jgi:cyclopropane fatty-acyl-phospholipid synthase-like methyltransferase
MPDTIDQELTEFYDEATEDYLFWSKSYNMHFGYYRLLHTNPFKRDSMLNEMNEQVYKRLRIGKVPLRLADLGCGMGATMKHGLKAFPHISITGLTLSQFQFNEGNTLLTGYKGSILKENYNAAPFADGFFHGLIAVESFCHSGHSKHTLKEAFRLLAPKGRLVIADAFLKKPPEQLSFTARYAYRKLCEGWKLSGLGDIINVRRNLEEAGFKDIVIEDISFRVAPSVMHVPFATLGFMLRKKWKGEHIRPQSLNNLKGSVYALLSGMHLRAFGYYMISCEKLA